jgi:Pyruvate/2-oxoacid:ferredoxin oxidoreductase delta subunit
MHLGSEGEETSMSHKSYEKLADHLYRLGGNFPPTETGAELALLAALCTPEEAELATHVTVTRETADVIAARAGLETAEAKPLLDSLAHQGMIFAVEPEDGPKLYQAAPWYVGIIEFQIDRMTPELLEKVRAYHAAPKRPDRPLREEVRQVRTIPVGEAIPYEREVLPYDRVEAIIDSHDRFAVTTCICRHDAELAGAGCEAPQETCMMFDEWADYYVREGKGRAIEREEIFEILARADEANLVLQPSNSQDVAFLCCCCGCCCSVLGGLKRQPKPAEALGSPYVAQLDAEACVSCWTCLDRCQMDALSEGETHVAFDADRCIGCGLCVTTCPTGALTLTTRPDRSEPLADMTSVWQKQAVDPSEL